MTSVPILLVDDNPITRKLVRFSLEAQGFAMLEAASGKAALNVFANHPVSLVLQDLCLPDLDGFELAAMLRALPGGADVPMLAFSGMLSRQDEARVSSAWFDGLISKPVEPSRLIQIIRSYLPAAQEVTGDSLGGGRRIVVADDDPVQRKLVSFRMQKVGFEVTTAADGQEALEQIRRVRPHAVLSDVLMPGLDGFGLCLEVRRDPDLAAIPIVLTTNSYVEPTDRDFARRAGAHDLVIRTPELIEVLHALRESLTTRPAVPEQAASREIEDDHMHRMMRQLERQVGLNAGVNQRCALLSAEMTVLRGISEALAKHADIDEALKHTLAACFDADGISLGALYLKEERGIRALNFGLSGTWSDGELTDFFGEPDLLEGAMSGQRTTQLLADSSAAPGTTRLLTKAGAASGLIVPIAHGKVSFGALVMFSRNKELVHEDRAKFGEAVASQISQALAVAYAFREKERSERFASEQAAILRSVLESIGDGVGVVDEKGNLIFWNSAANDIAQLGSRTAESPEAFGIFDTDTVTPLAFERLPLTRAMHGEAIDGMELFVRHQNAPGGAWVSATGRPWRDDRGVARGGVAVFRDITREKATQAQLLVSDRMASVGMLAAGVAHEINNPLACVLANLELIHRDLSERTGISPREFDELKEIVAEARVAGDRVRQIVRDLKIFSRHEETRPGVVDVQKVLESSVRMAWNEIRHRARLVTEYQSISPVEGYESRLGQVFLNLIVNAAQAIPEGNAHGNSIRIATYTDPDGKVVVAISDTGAGIASSDIHHLFRPFYTTKGPGMGTGLGLAISHRIVTGMAGQITVDSELGKGTTFRVILPASGSTRVVSRAQPKEMAQAKRRARVLVIDDEPMIASLVRRILSKEHDVIVTLAAAEALALIRSGEQFDVILCDLMMPQMTGIELLTELRGVQPELADRVILLTGGAFTPAARAFLDEVPNQRVEKPFDAQHLRAIVNDRIR